MGNHTIDCKWCGEDIRAMYVTSIAAHEDNCPENKEKTVSDAPKESSPVRATSDIIKELAEVRDERRRIADRDKELIEKWRGLEKELLNRFDDQGMLKATAAAGTATITEEILPNVVDWDAVYEHIQNTGDFYLLQKRPAAAAFRELHASGNSIPGIDAYTKRKIALRKK
jgi:hypothetical protein